MDYALGLFRKLVALLPVSPLGPGIVPGVKEQTSELSLSFDANVTPQTICKALDGLQGQFQLTRLELRAPHLEGDDWQRVVAVQALSRAVIQMSMLVHLSLPETLITEMLLLHLSVLPRLETLIVFPAPLANDLSGEGPHGFYSLRSLDLPNERLLQRFLSYPLEDLEDLKVGNIGRSSPQLIARRLTGLRRLHIEGPSLGSPEIFALGACFRLEAITIRTRHPLRMDDLDLHRFRGMFQNLHSLSIVPAQEF